MSNIIIKQYLGKGIEFKIVDGEVYASATSMVKSFPNKNLSTWINSKGTEEYIFELCNENKQDKDFYLEVKHGGTDNGTWIHETLILDLAKWCNIKFRIWCDNQITTLIRERTKVKSILTSLESVEFKGNIDNLVYSKNGKPITTSRIIAEYTSKEHKHILRDIRNEIDELKKISPNLSQSITSDFSEMTYLDTYGREQVEYELGEMATMQILLKYSTEYRAKFIMTFQKMKETIMSMFKIKVLENVLPQDNRLRQYVYIIKNNDTNRIKVGIAQSVDKRLKQLQTGSDSELVLVYRSLICSNALDIEKFMHKTFKDKHVRGEWFNISETEVINELEKCNYVLKSELIKELGLTDTMFDK